MDSSDLMVELSIRVLYPINSFVLVVELRVLHPVDSFYLVVELRIMYQVSSGRILPGTRAQGPVSLIL